MKLGVTVALLIAILTALGVFAVRTAAPIPDERPTTPQTSEGSSSTSTALQREPITREPSSPDREVYVNQEWRFSFEYPKGWEVLSPVSSSPITFFNLGVRNPEKDIPILLDINPNAWIESTVTAFKEKGIDVQETVINSKKVLRYSERGWVGRPSKIHAFPVNDEYWVVLLITNGNEEMGYVVLESMTFHEPPVTLGELGIEASVLE